MVGTVTAGTAAATAAGAAGATTVAVAGTTVLAFSSAFAASVAVAVGNAALAFALSAASNALFSSTARRGVSSSGRTQSVKQPISVHRVVYGEVRVSGSMTFLNTTIDDGLFHQVLTLAGHEIDSVQQYFLNEEEQILAADGKPVSGKWNTSGSNPRARMIAGLGTTAGDSAFQTAMEANNPGVWTSEHKQESRAKIYIEGATNNFPNGLPNGTVILRGRKVLDTRTSTTAYSSNPALCIYDYLTNTQFGLGESTSRVNTASFNAAANVCDELVTLNDATTENRYTCNGTFETDEAIGDILGKMLSSCAGTLTYQGGEWYLYAGEYVAPTQSFDESHMVGPMKVQALIGRRDTFNAVKGVFFNPEDLFQPTDFPAVTNATYLAEDQGEQIFKDIELPFTTSGATAQRLAKIELEKSRQQKTVDMQLNIEGLKVQVGEVINISNVNMGWSDKPFEVVKWELVNRGGSNAVQFGVNVTLRETASTVYDWANGEETTIDPSPDTNLPDPFADPSAPSTLLILSGNEGLREANDGTILVNLFATWVDPVGSFIRHIETQFKPTTSSVWAPGPDVFPGSQEVILGPVDEKTTWDVQVRAVSTFQKPSPWIDSLGHVVTGKTEAPTRPSTFSFTEQPDGTRSYSWTHVDVPADVRSGGGYEIRWFSGTTSTWSAMNKLHTGVLLSSPHEDNQLAAGTYTFAIKAIDSTGNESVNARFITAVSLNNPRIGSALISRNESSLDWPGTFIDSRNDDGVIVGDNSSDWTGMPATWAAMPATWNEILSGANPFYYTTPEIDLESDVKMSVLASIQGVGSPDITIQTGTDSDGAVVGTVSITSSSVANPSNILAVGHGMITGEEVRIFGHSGSTPDINGFHTVTRIDDDNYTIPVNVTTGGTGGSSEHFKVPAVETIRYLKVRVKMTGANSLLSELTTIVDSPSITESFEDVNTASETATWFNSIATGHFQIGSTGGLSKVTQAVIVAIQNVPAGYSWVLINKTSTVNSLPAAEFKIYDETDTLADAVIDLTLRGARV